MLTFEKKERKEIVRTYSVNKAEQTKQNKKKGWVKDLSVRENKGMQERVNARKSQCNNFFIYFLIQLNRKVIYSKKYDNDIVYRLDK